MPLLTPEYLNLTAENIPRIFGQDAAELETLDRLKAFFVINESYDQVRIGHPVSLVIGQRGIGKTALLRMSAAADAEVLEPYVFMTGSKILKLADANQRAAVAVEAFKSHVENAVLDALIQQLSENVAEALPVPKAARSIMSRLAALSAAVVKTESQIVQNNASKLMPWIYKEHTRCTIYIDDTDIEWDGNPDSAATIAHLIHACFLLASESTGALRFKISVRSDVFNYIKHHFSNYIGKIQAGIVYIRWTNDDILRVIAKRMALFFEMNYDDGNNLKQNTIFSLYYELIFAKRFRGQGAWANTEMRHVIMSLVRQRPRDLITICTMAAQRAAGKSSLISTEHVEAAIPSYCQAKLIETVNEFEHELPQVDFLLREMRPRAAAGVPRYRYTDQEFRNRIREIQGRKRLMFSYRKTPASTAELLDFLFRMNFVVATREAAGEIERRYYDFAEDIEAEIPLGRWGWEVHMAYRWALKRSEDSFWDQVRA
jgi:hypothetical protein